MRLLLLAFSTALILCNCSSTVTLHPVDEQDIVVRDDGWVCMSPAYREEIARIKLEKTGF